MAFPVVVSRTLGRTTNTNTATHAITMPATMAVGDLLLVVFSVDGNPTVTASQAGWTKLGQASSTTVATGAIFYKVATTTSEALTLTTSATEASSHVVYRITGAASTVTATSANGTTANTDPPVHTPPGGAKDYLWIATRSADSTNVATAAPSSYTPLTTQAATGTNGASTNTADRSLNAASENPATFTSTAIGWAAWTIAVEPAPPAAQSRTMNLLASTATVADPSVIAPQSFVMAPLGSTAAVATPTVARTLTVTLAPVAASSSVATPTVAASLTRTAVAIASTASVATPTLIAPQARAMELVASTASVATPTVATRYPVTIASTAAVGAPTVATRYPVLVASTAAVAAPTVVIRATPTTVVNKPTTRAPAAGLAPSTSLLPSAGGDRFFLPTATVNLWITVLPEPVGSTAIVEQPTLQPGAATVTPTRVESAATVGPIAAVDTITLHRYPRLLSRALVPSPSLVPSTQLIPASGLSTVFAPTVWLGVPQTVDNIATVASTATVHVPATPRVTLRPRPLTRAVIPRANLAPSTDLVLADGLSTVHAPGAVPTEVFPATVLPSLGPPLYPAPELHASPDLYPAGTQVRPPTVQIGTVHAIPESIPSGSAVHPPTPSGSGVNYVPLFTLTSIPSTAVVAAPTTWVEAVAVEVEFLDSEESVELPNLVLQGALLVLAQFIASTAVVSTPTLTTAAQVHPLPVVAAAVVHLPRLALPQARTVQMVPSGASVGRPRVMGDVPPVRPVTGVTAAAPVTAPAGFRAGGPVALSGVRSGVPTSGSGRLRAGAPVPA